MSEHGEEPVVMMLMCSKGCGESIGVTQKMIDEALRKGVPVDVQHQVCPNEESAPKRNFRTVIEVWEDFPDDESADSEKLASFGGRVESPSFKTAIPKLAESMQEGWNRVVGLAHMIDAEVTPNTPQVVVQEVPSDQQG